MIKGAKLYYFYYKPKTSNQKLQKKLDMHESVMQTGLTLLLKYILSLVLQL